MYRLASAADPLVHHVDREVGGLDDGLVGRGMVPAEGGAQPGQELVDAERFGDVIVGPGVECSDLVGIAVAGRQHDDGDRRPAAKSADHVDAIETRQTEVQQHEVWRVGCGFGQCQV